MDDTQTGFPPADESDRGTAAPPGAPAERDAPQPGADGEHPEAGTDDGDTIAGQTRRRRRGSRGGQSRKRTTSTTGEPGADDESDEDTAGDDTATTDDAAPPGAGTRSAGRAAAGGQPRKRAAKPPARASDDDGDAPATSDGDEPELPDRIGEGRVTDPAVAEEALVRKPKIGDTRPAPLLVPSVPPPGPARPGGDAADGTSRSRRRRRGGKGRGSDGAGGTRAPAPSPTTESSTPAEPTAGKAKRGRKPSAKQAAAELELIEQRGGRTRDGKPIGRYFMAVQVRPGVSQVAVLEGRTLIEHYVSRPADDVSQIHGNVYLGRVQNVLPGMEAAFVDIATPKNAVLYRGDVQYDAEDVEVKGKNARIEDILRNRQMIMCQVTKNPIGAKGARLTQEISLPGRFVVLIPNSKTYGISKRLPDDTRKRLRNILDRVKPAEHGLIVRTAAEHATEADLEADMRMLLGQWHDIEAKAAKLGKPGLLYREPELAVRVIREEFTPEYRGVVIDDRELYEEVRRYVEAFNPELADRIEYYDPETEGLSLFERFHIHEQVHKALDRKVWLPSGGSLIIEHTEALTVIDVNTGKNVGKSNLEETVFHNNLEAAEEIAKQLRLRDIGGIIVIDFIDMEIRDNRAKVVRAFREALARDKTRTQVFDISELGLCEMTRKRIGEGLLTEFSETCPECEGRGVKVDYSMLE